MSTSNVGGLKLKRLQFLLLNHSSLYLEGLAHLGSDFIAENLDPLLDAVGQAIHLSSNKVQLVPLLLTLLQAANPVRSQGSEKHTVTQHCSDAHFLSADAMLIASITALMASVIWHARTVCCSNLVRTAEWEMNSCRDQDFTLAQTSSQSLAGPKGTFSTKRVLPYLKRSLEPLELC